jgi:hypothetical protein
MRFKAQWLSGFFLSALILLPGAAWTDDSPALLFRDDFRNWRDNASDPGFNTTVRSAKDELTVTTLDVDYGKAMSKSDPITINITKQTEVVVNVASLDPGGAATVSLMSAYEPYDAYQVARIEGKPGEYKANVNKLSGWLGVSSVWIVVWSEGKNKSITFRDISFQDEAVKAVRAKEAALKSYMSKTFTPVPGNSIYYEDFRNGLSGWRTAETDPSFFSELNFEDGSPRLRFIQHKGWCKIMSPLAGIQADITSNTRLQVGLGDLGNKPGDKAATRLKVDVMSVQPPFEERTVIAWQKTPGVYTANLSETSKWFGPRNFWLAIWMEGQANGTGEQGAQIKFVRVFESQE